MPEFLARSDELSVDSVRMPLLSATDLLLSKLRALGEHHCNLSPVVTLIRSLRTGGHRTGQSWVGWPSVCRSCPRLRDIERRLAEDERRTSSACNSWNGAVASSSWAASPASRPAPPSWQWSGRVVAIETSSMSWPAMRAPWDGRQRPASRSDDPRRSGGRCSCGPRSRRTSPGLIDRYRPPRRRGKQRQPDATTIRLSSKSYSTAVAPRSRWSGCGIVVRGAHGDSPEGRT